MEKIFLSLGNDEIEFISLRPGGSKSVILDRQIKITGPKKLVELSENGDLEVLNNLISCLKDKDQAWTAAVLLSAMTGRDGKTIEVYSTSHETWWDTYGESAHNSWNDWYKEAKDSLKWDEENKRFR